MTATPEQFEALQAFTHRKISELGSEISDGQIGRSPIQWGQNQACDFCEYRRDCPFDERLPGNACRKVEKMNAAEFWEKIDQ